LRAFRDILPTEGPMTKTCFKCGISKKIDDFYVHPQMKDGHLGKCKECCKMDEKLRRIENPEKYSKYEKTRGRSAGAEARTKEWRAKYPERYRAHNAVNNALRDGRIIRPETCEICGSKNHLHAHHSDYSEKLSVVWLCARCHGQIQ
jgi:hypothetical protein